MKYVECLIQWVDDLSEMEVIIKTDEEFDKFDDRIFFYGLSEEELCEGLFHGTIFEGEWRVLDILDHYDEI